MCYSKYISKEIEMNALSTQRAAKQAAAFAAYHQECRNEIARLIRAARRLHGATTAECRGIKARNFPF